MQPTQKYIAKIDGRGRPPVIEEKLPIVLEGLKKVLIMRHAAGYAQIHYTTLFGWMRQGREDIAEGKWTVHANFFYQVKRCLAQEVEKHLERIASGADRWQSSAWILERVYRDDFALDGGVIRVLMDKAEELQRQFNQLVNKDNKEIIDATFEVKE